MGKMPLWQNNSLSDQAAIDVGDFMDHQLSPALAGARNDYPTGGRPETRVTERLEQGALVHSEDSGYGYSLLGVPVATAIRCQSAHGVVVSSVAAHPESDRFP